MCFCCKEKLQTKYKQVALNPLFPHCRTAVPLYLFYYIDWLSTIFRTKEISTFEVYSIFLKWILLLGPQYLHKRIRSILSFYDLTYFCFTLFWFSVSLFLPEAKAKLFLAGVNIAWQTRSFLLLHLLALSKNGRNRPFEKH